MEYFARRPSSNQKDALGSEGGNSTIRAGNMPSFGYVHGQQELIVREHDISAAGPHKKRSLNSEVGLFRR